MKTIQKSLLFFKLMAIYILLYLSYYYVVVEDFAYEGFTKNFFSYGRLTVSLIFLIFNLCLVLITKKGFMQLVNILYLVLVYYGQSIYYTFEKVDAIILMGLSFPIILVTIFSRVSVSELKSKKSNRINMDNKKNAFIIISITLMLTIPFLKNWSQINIKNLFFIDVYDTRYSYIMTENNIFMRYLVSPIARVMLPFLIIYFRQKRKKILEVATLIVIALLYLLSGALKSIIFELILVYFFFFGDYEFKQAKFLKYINLVMVLSLLEKIVFNKVLITDYARRIFFVPPKLFNVYYYFFENRYTYFLHSRLAKTLDITGVGIHGDYFGKPLPSFIGHYVMGYENLIANVGIFCEGYFSFGIMGMLVVSFIYALFIKYIDSVDIEPAYFGILATYIYIINTSYIETLMFTHGLLFYIIYARYIIPKRIKLG